MTKLGRKRTQMKLGQGSDAHQVCSKRRSGLFKKASELCTLVAVEAALVILSPGGTVFPVGYPAAEIILNQLAPTGNSDSVSTQFDETEHEATLCAPKKEYHDLLEQLEAEKKRGKILNEWRMRKQREGCLMYTPVDELNLPDLLMLKAMLEDFHGKLIKNMQERAARSAAASNSVKALDLFPTNPAEGSCSVDPGN